MPNKSKKEAYNSYLDSIDLIKQKLEILSKEKVKIGKKKKNQI